MEQSVLSEWGLLGSLLLDPSQFPQVSGLRDDDFSSLPLCELFRAMRRLYEKAGDFDVVTVRAEAGKACPQITDRLMLDILDVTPTTANLLVYAAAVKEAALGRRLKALGEKLVSSECAPSDALSAAYDALQGMLQENGQGEAATILDALHDLYDRVDEQSGGKAPCVPTGLKAFDQLLGGGLINGGLHIIAARPAVGKSAVALQIAINAARSGAKVLYISLEMSAEDCVARMIATLGQVSAARLMFGGHLTDREYSDLADGAEALNSLPIVFNRWPGMNIRRVEALCFKEKPRLLVVDHIGLLEPPERKLTLYEATTRNSRALKLLALRLKIPVLCLCQLNRAAASDRSASTFRATMANLRESGALEQDADSVTLLNNPPCESSGAELPSLLELWLDKNRRGPTGKVEATFFRGSGAVIC